MGFQTAWIARRGKSTKELLSAFGLVASGARDDVADLGLYLVELPETPSGAWVLLVADGSDYYSSLREKDARALSADGGETLYFWCSDTVMATELVCHRDGRVAWVVRYDCESRSPQPTLQGDLPKVADRLLEDLRASQDADPEVDHIYELSAALGEELLDYRHDATPTTGHAKPFQQLIRR